jgi:hypothetical protein
MSSVEIRTAIHEMIDLFLGHSVAPGRAQSALLFLPPFVDKSGILSITGEN